MNLFRVKQMNLDINIEVNWNIIINDSQVIYADLSEGLGGVTNALDNIDLRIYRDRSVYNIKLLLEPNIIFICTLKNFPNAIEHTFTEQQCTLYVF